VVTTKLLVISGASRQNTFLIFAWVHHQKGDLSCFASPCSLAISHIGSPSFSNFWGLLGREGLGKCTLRSRTRGTKGLLGVVCVVFTGNWSSNNKAAKTQQRNTILWNFSSHYQWMEYLSIMIYPSIHPSIHPSINVHIHVHIYILI